MFAKILYFFWCFGAFGFTTDFKWFFRCHVTFTPEAMCFLKPRAGRALWRFFSKCVNSKTYERTKKRAACRAGSCPSKALQYSIPSFKANSGTQENTSFKPLKIRLQTKVVNHPQKPVRSPNHPLAGGFFHPKTTTVFCLRHHKHRWSDPEKKRAMDEKTTKNWWKHHQEVVRKW